jgi:hypothetical protein
MEDRGMVGQRSGVEDGGAVVGGMDGVRYNGTVTVADDSVGADVGSASGQTNQSGDNKSLKYKDNY